MADKTTVRKTVEKDFRKRGNREMDDDDDDLRQRRRKKQHAPKETKETKEHEYSRQYRDRAKERREGIKDQGDDQQAPLGRSIGDALFEAAVSAAESGQIPLPPPPQQQQQQQSESHSILKHLTFETRQQALDWLAEEATTTQKRPPQNALAQNICHWLREQHLPSESKGAPEPQAQQQQSYYTFLTQSTTPWEPPVLDTFHSDNKTNNEPWVQPFPEALLTQVTTSLTRITEKREKKKRIALQKEKPTVLDDDEDIFALAGKEYTAEVSSSTHPREEDTSVVLPFREDTTKSTETAPTTTETRLTGFSELKHDETAIMMGVGVIDEDDDDDKKKKKKRGRRSQERR